MDTKRLRQKILDLAIRGKLVPQAPNDEPASVLLERISAEKERLIKEGKIKRSKKSASDTPHYENMPFEIPKSWEWVSIADIAIDMADGPFGSNLKASHYTKDREVRIIQLSNIGDEGWREENTKYTTFEHLKEISRSEVLPNDIIIAKMMPAGRAIICPNHEPAFVLSSDAVKLRPSKFIDVRYILHAINSPIFQEQVQDNVQGVTRLRTSIEKLKKYFIPLPPYSEQKRIVKSIEQHLVLVDNIDFETNILRIYINKCKAKILELAIHGKLVPQNSNDEPALDLLKRINPSFVPCDNAHYTDKLPDSWCWATFNDVCTLITGSTPSKLHSEYYGGDFPFYKPSDLDAGRHVTIPSEYLTEEGKSVSRIIPQGSTSICCIGSIGKCGYIEREGTTNQQINTAVPLQSLNPLYLFYFCNSIFFIDELTADSSAITISIVNKSKLGKMFISLPPIKEQQRIVRKIEELFTVLDEIKESLEA